MLDTGWNEKSSDDSKKTILEINPVQNSLKVVFSKAVLLNRLGSWENVGNWKLGLSSSLISPS